MSDYEKLGAFYLGRLYDVEGGQVREDSPLLYDAKDLTTHAVCVGMTGSGKTGLGVTLLEEAAIDGIPTIAIDPKGDLGNLMLTFPDLRADDFRPWIDESEAARKGRTPAEQARAMADLWKGGLSDWGQDGSRIARFRDSVDTALYTPGSSAGRSLAVLRSFRAPSAAVAADSDALRERLRGAVAGLLGLLGLKAEPLRSREFGLLSAILDSAWREGRDMDLPTLIRAIQTPPFERVGVFDLESFYPAKERFELAMQLNNLIAAPGFEAWTVGEPLDIGSLLYSPGGKPKLSIISIAHLSESERMFFVTLLLNEIVAWVRSQPGSRSLRALIYMDEVFGYFPPTAEPPSKRPMLTLLKQARAYGVGVVLATQNPVDLDYKGLSNAGTWFLGRLQTERDKARVMDGLEGASAAAGASFDRMRIERILSGLGSRVFLMNNVHEDAPVVFHTRWALSYLAGPLTREQIKRLGAREAEEAAPPPRPPAAAAPAPAESAGGASSRPMIPPGVSECFLSGGAAVAPNTRITYRPGLLATATLHYSNSRAKVDEWGQLCLLAPLSGEVSGSPWEAATKLGASAPAVFDEPQAGAAFATLPAEAAREKSYPRWRKMLVSELYRSHPMKLWRCPSLKEVSRPGESEGEFRGRVRDRAREERDLELEKLRKRYAPKLARVKDQIRRAEEKVEREGSQYDSQKMQTAISLGSTILGALFGRKLGSLGNVGRATTTMRGADRAARAREDIKRAEEGLEASRERFEKLEAEFEEELAAVRDCDLDASIELEAVEIAPRKSDLSIDRLTLVWTPWKIDGDGIASPLY